MFFNAVHPFILNYTVTRMIKSIRSLKVKATKKKKTAVIENLKPAIKPYALSKKELNAFLTLHVGDATDAYLRDLASCR